MEVIGTILLGEAVLVFIPAALLSEDGRDFVREVISINLFFMGLVAFLILCDIAL